MRCVLGTGLAAPSRRMLLQSREPSLPPAPDRSGRDKWGWFRSKHSYVVVGTDCLARRPGSRSLLPRLVFMQSHPKHFLLDWHCLRDSRALGWCSSARGRLNNDFLLGCSPLTFFFFFFKLGACQRSEILVERNQEEGN